MDLLDAAIAGALAGYGIAIPVGAVAVLILDAAAQRGFRVGAAAGLGAATADGTYAVLAALFGATLAALVAPWETPLRWSSVVVLVAIAAIGLRAALRRPIAPRDERVADEAAEERDAAAMTRRGLGRTYGAFLGITIINPMTVVYFAALILGLPAVQGGGGARLAFAVAAFLASASWQLVLAGAGAVLHRHASPRMRRGTAIVGYLVILAFAARIALDLLA
jgi:threonine/homoserine/homoserine lactone efflux protein